MYEYQRKDATKGQKFAAVRCAWNSKVWLKCTWSVVFILPINSSLNPYLYTIASLIGDYKKAARKSSQQLKTSTNDTELKSK